MKRVQHDKIKPGMKIKLADYGPRGRWIGIDKVHEVREARDFRVASTSVQAHYIGGRTAGEKINVLLYERPEGYELHPQSALLTAQEVMRAGRADVQNVVLREYSIKLAMVDKVDNQGMNCGYCNDGPNAITSNIYATVTTDSGRTEESAWSTCTRCAIPSIDEVEDVDPSYTVTIERAQI